MTRPFQVTHVVSALVVGGVQNLLLALLPRLDPARARVRIICTYKMGVLAPRFEEMGIPVSFCRMRSRLNPADLWRMSRLLKEQGADIVHTHMYASNVSGAVAARLAGIRHVVSHLHSDHELTTSGRVRSMRWTDWMRQGYIAVSEHVRRDFVEKTGVPESRTRVCYNAIDLPPFEEDATAGRALREEFGFPPGCLVAGTVSRLVPVKGVDIFVRAAGLVARREPRARFVVVGGGKEREALERLAAECGLGNKIVFTGERRDVRDFYRMFDVFALTSRSEGFGNVLLEAIHYGVPVVASRVGGIPEVVLDGETGLLAAPESPESAAEAIGSLLEDRVQAAEFVRRARQHAKRFSLENGVNALLSFYEEMFAKEKL